MEDEASFTLDCYPYGFSPLLLFAQENYFDKGHSNYNSVAQFFNATLKGVDMLENVLYDRKNMLYEELLQFVTDHRMIVACCIDAHFTAFQVLGENSLIYYDPLSPNLSFIDSPDSFRKFVLFLLMKCNYGDNQHIQDNKSYYTGTDSTPVRRAIYALWKDINKLDTGNLYGVRSKSVGLNVNRHVLVNHPRNPKQMSTQLTGNTCYFQAYLFALMCKVGCPALSRDGSSIELRKLDDLEDAVIRISAYLLQFFVEQQAGEMRPLTNSNVVLDFHRYQQASYFELVTKYLQGHRSVPEYDLQYRRLLEYYWDTRVLHKYSKFQLSATMSSTPNTKSLQLVCDADEDAIHKLCKSNYYKYRAANLMFGFNTGITARMGSFCEFNSLRKNQLLAFYKELLPLLGDRGRQPATKYRDYYFMPQFEVGQRELVDLHEYTYDIDMHAMGYKMNGDAAMTARVHAVNMVLAARIYFSTQNVSDYHKFMSDAQFQKSRNHFDTFLKSFMSIAYFSQYAGLGFSQIILKEKEVNALTQTAFYDATMMSRQAWRMEYEFEKECINQMARSTLKQHLGTFNGSQNLLQTYAVSIKIGHGFTYSKYNTLMHFLNVAECYWQNPDLNSIQVFGKDIRTLLAISCQKIFFEQGHNYYHYGPIEMTSSSSGGLDLQVATTLGEVTPYVSREKRGNCHSVVVTDRVYEYEYLRTIVSRLFDSAKGARMKTDDVVLNLCLLSLQLDFGLCEKHAGLLNLPFLQSLNDGKLRDTRQLQVEVSNWINEFDKKNTVDSVTRLKVEELIFEASYKFIVNKNFSVRSKAFELIRLLNADPVYHQYLLLCKVYVSLCQINKSAEVDYYKIFCNNEYRIVIPMNFSKSTCDYLEAVTQRYTFTEREGLIKYGDLSLFDLRASQPEINLYKVRFDSSTAVQSMVKYVEFSNVFRAFDSERQYLIFIADNALNVEVDDKEEATIRINKILVEIATIFFNDAISFVPCFKYADSEDVILFTSRNIHYLVDKAGQFNENYYGMKHELIECITSDQIFVDLNDEYVFKNFKLSELLTESKTVLYFPDYLLQVQSQQQLINLLDLAIYLRNVSFFILVLYYLRRASISLDYIDKEGKTVKITGPWKQAILYVLNRASNPKYDEIFQRQFFDLNQHEKKPLAEFVDILCENFTRYQRSVDGQYQIVPTDKQKRFLQHIISAPECFHFSEVGSGKTKVILPLLCQLFLSNNIEAHTRLARGGQMKNVLVILVPEHLVPDAKAQVFRYCLNLNFREEYRIYDDIFALLHEDVQLGASSSRRSFSSGSSMKQIFITSFNQFKKALTYDKICAKVRPHRERILVVVDEVDDFLDRDKLVFNICSNMSNSFNKETLDSYYDICRSVYKGEKCPASTLASAKNKAYWQSLHEKFEAIHLEIQEKSRSLNKNFGIFNEQTLRHCCTNIAQDIEGYKSLIARPYESVNRAMPGSYYSDAERTIYLTYYITQEDVAKYDELFQQERKFISFEYFTEHIGHIDFDDLVYGNAKLSELVVKHPEIKDGLTRFLYEIILRRMEIRDKSRSVNSIDVVFNFDCVGFTGTPFIDNYPTFSYLRKQREDRIPDLIDRSFYAYSSEQLSAEQFTDRFQRFQGRNSNVLVEYLPSDFMQRTSDELAILGEVFSRHAKDGGHSKHPNASSSVPPGFNALVDLCGIVKKASVYDVRDLLVKYFGADRFHYIYHISQTDSSDRVLHLESGNDVQFDEEFYNFLCKTYGEALRERVFFFVDNRNVIGKDVPFQLVHQRRFEAPLFFKSVILAHDVDDFSKIWQAMGRSRTMNDTLFAIYKNKIDEKDGVLGVPRDIKESPLTRKLYVRNCDCKMAGNLSSIYQTLISLNNLSQNSFYYCDEIVNVFIEKMEMTIVDKVRRHESNLAREIVSKALPSGILTHILEDKFRKSSNISVSSEKVTSSLVQALLRHVVQQKYEQRTPSNNIYDHLIAFLSGEQDGVMEISYTKQQQKQKQKQHNKDQDADTMEIFDKKHQLQVVVEMENYFAYTLNAQADVAKASLNLPIGVPIFKLSYMLDGTQRSINIFPTLQFLYSHHINPEYITTEVRDIVTAKGSSSNSCERFFQAVERVVETDRKTMLAAKAGCNGNAGVAQFGITVHLNQIRQNPHYTLAALRQGVYVIGMKDQFNIHDLPSHPLQQHVQYIADEMGFILYSREGTQRNIDSFGPYFVEQYILMEVLSKQEIAQNVLDYYAHRKEKLRDGVESYSEAQGKGFICWRFINEHRQTSVFL
eukprot:TRINITY_DN9823_c2_g4_i1.p1 TRINITY_DN9823_c2_g4~~TRINITY_DN9823_c2_g4_i1.p1  ORF type:complete len:2328 (+),score=476.05 TRINITY_DN9823_c2_g4_i1:208-6984(+)